MKTSFVVIIAFGAGTAILPVWAIDGTATNASTIRMEKRVEVDGRSLQSVSEVERLWPSEPDTYFCAAATFAKIALGQVHTNAAVKTTVLVLFDNVLQKTCPPDDQQAITCFDRKYQAIMHCLNLEEVREDKSRLMAIARFLGEVRARRIPHYKARGTRFHGQEILIQAGVMEFSSLTNPVLKTAYRQAVEKNAQDQVMNDLQQTLKAVDGSTTHFLLGTLRSIPRKESEFIERIMDAAHLPQEERGKL